MFGFRHKQKPAAPAQSQYIGYQSGPPVRTTVNGGVISQAVKDQVWRLDKGKCRKCGSTENLQFDHIYPWSKGGQADVGNVQLLCQRCNRQKSAGTNMREWASGGSRPQQLAVRPARQPEIYRMARPAARAPVPQQRATSPARPAPQPVQNNVQVSNYNVQVNNYNFFAAPQPLTPNRRNQLDYYNKLSPEMKRVWDGKYQQARSFNEYTGTETSY